MLSRFIFERYYSRVPLYFMSRAGSHVVPDHHHVPEALLLPSRVVEALLDGPSEQIARTVTNAIPAGVRLGENGATIDASGVVTVDLEGLDQDMTVEARRGLGAQLLWSLTAIPRLTGLIITQDRATFALPGANAAGVLEFAGQQGYQVLSRGATPNLYGVSDGVPGRLGEDSRFVPLLPRSDGSADAAVSLDGVTVAYIDSGPRGTEPRAARRPGHPDPTRLHEPARPAVRPWFPVAARRRRGGSRNPAAGSRPRVGRRRGPAHAARGGGRRGVRGFADQGARRGGGQ